MLDNIFNTKNQRFGFLPGLLKTLLNRIFRFTIMQNNGFFIYVTLLKQ